MGWATYVQYGLIVYNILKATKRAVDAYINGDTAGAVHAATDTVRPFIVGAVGKQCGDSSKHKGGVASAVAGATIDIAVSVATGRHTGIAKAASEKNIIDAAEICLSDFMQGYAESKDEADGEENNKNVNFDVPSELIDLNGDDSVCTLTDESKQDTPYSSDGCSTDEPTNPHLYLPSTAN